MNCTPFVGQYGILFKKWGVFLCQKEYQTNDIRRSSKRMVVETMEKEHLSIRATMQEFGINDHKIIERWERIYLTEGPEGLAIERRGRGSKGRPPKQLPEAGGRRSAGRSPAAACGERLPKKLASLGFGRRATPAQKTLVVQKLRQRHSLDILLSIAQLPRATFYYHLKRMQNRQTNMHPLKEEITAILPRKQGAVRLSPHYNRTCSKRKFSLNHKTVQRLMKELGLGLPCQDEKISLLQG